MKALNGLAFAINSRVKFSFSLLKAIYLDKRGFRFILGKPGGQIGICFFEMVLRG